MPRIFIIIIQMYSCIYFFLLCFASHLKKTGKKFNKKRLAADQDQEISHYHQKDIS